MSQTVDLDELITNKEAATLLKIQPNTLEIWRHQGKGPPFLKLGDAPNATVRYQRSAVIDWAAERAFTSTSAHSAAMSKPPVPLKVAPGAIPGPWQGTTPGVNGNGGASK